jgi:putative transposase
MIRTNIIELKPNKEQIKILKEGMLLSSSIYNMINFEFRQAYFNNKKIPSFFDLEKKYTRNDIYQHLGRSYAAPMIQKSSEMIRIWFSHKKSKNIKKLGLPKYFKNRKTNTTIPSYLVIDNYSYLIRKNNVMIPLSYKMRKKYNIKTQQFNIKYTGILKWKGKQLRGEIHYKDGKFYLYQSVEITILKKKQTNIIAGIDLGIKRLFTIVMNNNVTKIIGNKRFFQQWCYYEKKIAKEQQILSYIKRKTSKKLKRLYLYCRRWKENLYNNIVAKVFRILIKNNVTKIFIGNVKHILYNLDKGKKINKMLNNYWAFDKLYRKMTNKAEENGIEIIKIKEEYTTQKCPRCNYIHQDNINDRKFVCLSCGYINDRDIVGAKNIMFKGMNSLQSIHWNEIIPLGGSSFAISD